MKRCVIIYNPNSKKINNFSFINEFTKILYKNDYECELFLTAYAGHAIKIVEEISAADLIISIGGDGTFNEVVTGNLKRKQQLLLAHIPFGTTNDIGAMFGYNGNIIENLKQLLSGSVQNIDLCTINKQPFVYVAGFGKFVNISYSTPTDMKKKWGYLAYLIEGLKELNGMTHMYDLEYIIDNQKYHGKYSLIMISNANRIAGIDNFYKDVTLNDNKFELLLCDLNDKKDIIRSLYFLKTKDITKLPGFYFHKTDNLKIKFNDLSSSKWSIDGEEFTTDSNVEIAIINNFKILMPNKNIKKLFLEKEKNNEL